MHGLIAGLCGLSGAAAWLVLLVATDFNAVVVSGGLLAAVVVVGNTAGDQPHRPDGSIRR